MNTVVVADDHPVTLQGISSCLKNLWYEVVDEVTTVADVLDRTEKFKPDFLVLDLFLEDGNSLIAIENLREISKWTKIVILSMSNRPMTMLAGYEYGADAYLSKDVSFVELHKAIETVLSGKIYYMPGVEEQLEVIRQVLPEQGPLDPRKYLNLIDLHIFEDLAKGFTLEGIADGMNKKISIKTINNRVCEICAKLKIKRHQVREVAVQYGLIKPDI